MQASKLGDALPTLSPVSGLRPPTSRSVLFVLLCLICGTGCADVDELDSDAKKPKDGASQAAPAKPAAPTITSIPADDLPKMGALVGPLDDGHLEVPVPDGWYVPPRDSKYLFRMAREQNVAYPTIIVEGGEKEAADPDSLGKENVLEYAKSLQADLAGAGEPPEVRALNIDGVYAVAYDKGAKAGGTSLNRQFLITIQQGRKYTVELRAFRGTLKDYRGKAYGVAARLKIK
jgi:hypothetical protein